MPLKSNTLLAIHKHIAAKAHRDNGRIADFAALLSALATLADPATVLKRLQVSPDFLHHSMFKRNRYHDMRQSLATATAPQLQVMLDEYRAFLRSAPPDARAPAAERDMHRRLLEAALLRS